MRLLKIAVLGLLGFGLVVIGVANMEPVDLRLLPEEIGNGAVRVGPVPLSAVILAAVVVGIFVGQVMEWLRESQYRRLAEDRLREVGRLRRELRRMAARFGDTADDLPDHRLRR